MLKCSSTILYAACTFRPYKSTPVLKLFRTFTGKMTRGLSLQMVFSPLFVETLFIIFSCPANHVPDWQPRNLLGMVEARSVNVKNTHTTHAHTDCPGSSEVTS